jgi:hypothetical protein
MISGKRNTKNTKHHEVHEEYRRFAVQINVSHEFHE